MGKSREQWTRRLRTLLGDTKTSGMAGNATALYTAHVLGLIVPLLTIPYLARVLRPSGWGLVVFAQSFGAWLALVLEYGFDLSGTRAVARVRSDPQRLPEVVAGVQGAKMLMVLTAPIVVLILYLTVPSFQRAPAYLLWAGAFAVARALGPTWYFFGLERMKGAAIIEAGAKVLAALGVFLWVKGPEHGWRVLALQAVATSASLAWLTIWMYREIPMHRPRLAQALQTLKESSGVFLFRSSSGLYLQANAFVLGLLTTPQVVAFFGGAERIIRAAINLFHPLSQTLFPRMSHLMVTDADRAERLLTMGLIGMVGLGIAMGITAAVGAPTLVQVILGPGYESAIPVLRVLSVLPPVIAVGTVFGIQWALPMGLERPFYLFVLSAGVINIILAVLLVPRYGAVGMAVSVMTAEILVAGCLTALFKRKGGRLTPIHVLRGKGV